jgi:hypothetical protein
MPLGVNTKWVPLFNPDFRKEHPFTAYLSG